MRRTSLSVWAPLSPRVHLRRRRPLPFPFDADHRLYSRARHALWDTLRTFDLPVGGVVLAPAFHHGSEIEAVLRAGLDVRFYEIGDRLEPTGLDELFDDRVVALHLTHVLGVPQDAQKWRRWADERAVLLIEDVAQGWPGARDGRPLGSWGDISIFCAYKTLGVPDGGMVAAHKLPAAIRSGPGGWGRLARRHAAWLTGRSALASTALAPLRRPHAFSHQDDIGLGDPSRPASATAYCLPRAYEDRVAAARRDNFSYLKKALSDLFSSYFDVDLHDASPFGFPIEVGAKNEVDDALAREGVGAERFWAFPHPALPSEGFPRSRRLRERLLALPVHQELMRRDLDRVVAAVRRVVRG